MDEKISGKEFDTHVDYTRKVLDDFNQDLSLKSNIKDVCTLLD